MILAESLVQGWITKYWDADHEIDWLDSEIEHSVELTSNVLLMGRIDAVGRDVQKELFFGEWKTSKPEWRSRKGEWKQTWRLNPQSLTYGVLIQDKYPGCSKFTVRKAFKSDPPAYDHAWYRYSTEELEHWRRQLIRIGNRIRTSSEGPWETNFNACFKYGSKLPCPWFEPACSKLNWSGKPDDATPRISHLELERRLNEPDPVTQYKREDVIVLDATRVATWLDCHEKFRREYMENISPAPSEAMEIGKNFHDLLGEYYRQLAKGE